MLADPAAVSPVGVDGELLYLQWDESRVFLRPAAMDALVFKEIYLDDEYGIGAVDGVLDVVVDLGANTGLFASRVAPKARRVIAVEPVAENRRIARRNLEGARHGGEGCTLVPLAVAGESGRRLRLHLADLNTGAHSVSQDWAAAQSAGDRVEYEDVETISLADLFENEGISRCDLLKCDVEGAEYEIFRAAPQEILRRIDRIVMEVHVSSQAFPPALVDELREHLSAAGFSVSCPVWASSPDPAPPVAILEATRPVS